ncbi:MAG TPA: hypothetical protein PKJ63_04725 [Cyclobacteriaceae bacterium]|nr:hypothetical protein [Cyclobacteriaceae bacterium]HRW98309.1 hypothetical protein [Cyclobacteriaceae bacterium]
MKTYVLILAMSLLTQFSWASDKYEQAMLKNIEAVYDAETPEGLQQAVNAFERIGGAEKDKWEPFYYASFGYVMMSVREQDATKKDGLLDKAQEVLKKASAINSQESEIVALEGFIYMMKVTVDPASRGQQYSGLAMQTFGKALGMNPENPRALALMAQMELGTAQFFKSPIDKACATAKGALEKFDSFQSNNPLAPRWGRYNAMMVVNQCK